MKQDVRRPDIDREANPHPCHCGGLVRIVQDELGCEMWKCRNYPTCDEAYYTLEQARASERAYYAANPDKREAFFQKRGFYPGETDPAKRKPLRRKSVAAPSPEPTDV